MSYLEDDLRLALRRTEPPEDFTKRLLMRAKAPAPPEPPWWERLRLLLRPPQLQWVALSVVASIIMPMAGVQYRKQRQLRAEGERAKAQLVFAVRVAGSKLHRVQQKVLEMGRTDTRL